MSQNLFHLDLESMDLCQGDARDSCSSLASCRWPRLLSGELKTWQDAVGYRHTVFFWDVGEGNFYGFSRISQSLLRDGNLS